LKKTKNNHMNKILLVIIMTCLSVAGFSQTYFSVSPQSPDVYEVDRITGATVSTSTITIEGTAISGYGGMAINPLSGDVFAVAKISGGQRVLGILDLSDNTLSATVSLSDKFSGITFDEDGNCYGITGDGADVASSLYEINFGTGLSTFLLDVSSVGSDGETIAYNSFDGKIYRYAGGSVLQTINLIDLSTEEFTISIEPANYGQALYYEAGNNTFTLAAGGFIHTMTTEGVISDSTEATLGDDDGYKGIILDQSFVSTEEASAIEYSVYPNPSNDGTVNISSTSNLYSVSVYSIDGREVLLTKNIEALSTKIELTSGSYILKIETVAGEVSIEKLSIN
jgi:hypothetical protein